MIQRLKHIWNRTLAHSAEVTCIYICQLIFGLLVGCIFYSIVNENIGQSMALERLALGFDRTVIMDMINSNDTVFSKVFSWAMVITPIYLIVSTWLQGGLLFNIKKGETGVKSQLKNGIKHLIPFLGFALFSIVLILLFVIIIGLPFRYIVGDPLITFSSEKPFVFSIIVLLAILSICIITIWGLSISARYNYIQGSSFLQSISLGTSLIKNHFFKILSIGYLLIGIHLLMALVYYLIMGDRGAPSWLFVIFVILVQQLFSFARVYIRSFGYIAVDQVDEEFIG